MNLTALLRQRTARTLLVGAAVLLLLFQLSSLSAFLSSSTSSSPLSADHSRVVSELRADAATFSPVHSVTWVLAVMHELDSEVEVDNLKATLRLLRAAGVSDERVVVMERRARSGQSEQSAGLSSALGVRVLSLRRGSAGSSVQQYAEMLSAACSSSPSASELPASSSLCALVPSHVRLAADLPAYFFHVARLLKVDSTLLASSASSPFAALSLTSSWLPPEIVSSSAAGSSLRSSHIDSQLTSFLPATETALLLSAAAFASVSALLRSAPSTATSLAAALSSLSSGRSFVSPVVSRAVSLLPSLAERTSERWSVAAEVQPAVAWPELSRLSSVGYGHWLAALLSSCTLLLAPDDVMDRRGECAVVVVPAASSSDAEWHLLLSAWLGAYAMPPAGRQQEAVGEWRGLVVLRHLTNLLLLVAPYSPFFSFLPPLSSARGLSMAMEAVGCYRQQSDGRADLPHVLPFLSVRSLTPARCLSACLHRGYQYAGVEDGGRCRCGTAFTRSQSLSASSCPRRCSPSSSLPSEPPQSDACGGPSAVSLYTDSGAAHVRYQRESAAASFVRGREGESCTAACERASAGSCREELFALLTCGSMRSVGYKAGECVEAARLAGEEVSTRSLQALHVVAAPYIRTAGSDGVVMGASRWFDCHAVPLPETGRACVCG